MFQRKTNLEASGQKNAASIWRQRGATVRKLQSTDVCATESLICEPSLSRSEGPVTRDPFVLAFTLTFEVLTLERVGCTISVGSVAYG